MPYPRGKSIAYAGYGFLASVLIPEELSNIKLHKSNVNVTDLSALIAQTGDEFALFTRGSQRLIFRGNRNGVPLTKAELLELKTQGFKFSAHTHPGTSDIVNLF